MPVSVRPPPRVEQQLAEYCAHAKLTKSEAVKRALERLFEQDRTPASASAAAKRFVGSDDRTGDVARQSKKLLREHFRGKQRGAPLGRYRLPRGLGPRAGSAA